ncbi:hydantoinase B/oxoprolinase family protein [Amycolatopsis sp. NBC_01480]|uniref:hydantoinase B/oxoprolinase family protein n=1 Tax=Amycolatopsis sp. NBC_01480 TaxID=2903562 RepID=UPI002E297E8B|nr:hydantoinase B/oxoprolinase family protein [Amycolatopsis sp. NBC_01480]
MTTIVEPSGRATPSAVELEILRTTLIAQADEIAAVLANGAPIAEISQVRDFSVAIADASGGIAAVDNPLVVGSLAQSVEGILDYFEFDLKDGDIVVTNNPYAGGTRVQDLTLLAPLVVDSDMVLHIVVRVPIRDLGGQVGGNVYPAATELMAEGVPVTPIKIQRLGRPARDVLTTFLINGRRPAETRLVLDAATAAINLGLRRLTELVRARGATIVKAALAHAQTYSEQLTRSIISTWRDGTYPATRALAADPSGTDAVTVRLTATVERDTLTLDFSDSDDQRPSFVNSSSGTTASCALRTILAITGGSVPANSGLLRAVAIRTRPGSITHPVSPAPVGWGHAHCGNEITDAVAIALRAAVPGPVPSLTVARPLVLSRSASDTSDQTDHGRWGIGGASARPGQDGWGQPALATRAVLPSAEQYEIEHGIRLVHLEYAPDSAGAGQWVGAPGVEAVVEVLPDQLYTLWTQTAATVVDGLDDAVSGTPGEVAFHTHAGWEPAAVAAVEQPVPADQLRLRSAGGGGYGPPRARDRAAVLSDLHDDLITASTARETYGIDPSDTEQTQLEGGGQP